MPPRTRHGAPEVGRGVRTRVGQRDTHAGRVGPHLGHRRSGIELEIGIHTIPVVLLERRVLLEQVGHLHHRVWGKIVRASQRACPRKGSGPAIRSCSKTPWNRKSI